ncbi:hypothetical protein N7457_005246 [Penicillium paradoxum]|uniref:uncharacterized protein n=1 Tax=Penicillium paradoxum TaxID=176176 RepID=UPI0025477F28|nr:uncharacterized protein N7457_005246 [Penicillium paradoxum]KAJ5780086.1 hypothetical protein N7457_005246 [Penicillium paradoxum]
MRVGKGCARCRHRHIRCVIPTGASSCTPCSRLGRVCHLDPRFQFKSVHHVHQRINGALALFKLDWKDDQVWVDVSQPVTFVLDATDGLVADLPSEWEEENGLESEQSPSTRRKTQGLHAHTTNQNHPHGQLYGDHPHHGRQNSSPGQDPDDKSALSLREAFLVRHFIQKLAPWADICDVHSHFSTEVPKRALKNKMVLKAILALSARHDAIVTNDNDWEASAYHGQCLELLIAALDQAETNYDENMLITVVILRIYEELENNTDQKFHLLGSNRLVNLMARSASSGGVAEAVSWQFLRQAIYASVVQHQPLQLDMQNYERSSIFDRRDDAACASMIIYHCARILQLYFDAPGNVVNREDWYRISNCVNEWNETKPPTWQPIWYQASSVAARRPFPELWMISPPAVIGMQYYYSACIFLALSEASSPHMSDYEMARSRRLKEKTIADYLVVVIGLSISNESVENAYFMASHLLHRFGYCLRQKLQQQGSLDFLIRVEKVLGWRTSWIMEELQRQWTELAALEEA